MIYISDSSSFYSLILMPVNALIQEGAQERNRWATWMHVRSCSPEFSVVLFLKGTYIWLMGSWLSCLEQSSPWNQDFLYSAEKTFKQILYYSTNTTVCQQQGLRKGSWLIFHLSSLAFDSSLKRGKSKSRLVFLSPCVAHMSSFILVLETSSSHIRFLIYLFFQSCVVTQCTAKMQTNLSGAKLNSLHPLSFSYSFWCQKLYYRGL